MSVSGRKDLKVIRPAGGWPLPDFAELWRYRELVGIFVLRDIKVYYHQTVLGCLWGLVQPVMTMVVFAFVFGRWAKIPSQGFPYPVFVYAGLLPWLLFANSVSSCATSIINSSNLVTKVYFPRLIIPLSSVGSKLVDWALSFAVYLALLAIYGLPFHFQLVYVPFYLACTVMTSLGIGVPLAGLVVRYRDFRYTVPFLTQFWMYATPVIYPLSMIDAKWHWLFWCNPMTGVVEGFRSACLGVPFDSGLAVSSLTVSMTAFWIGIFWFRKMEGDFADVI